MKRLFHAATLALALSACKGNARDSTQRQIVKEKGTLHGNVFYTYNEYVGSKPDAGAHARLYQMTDTAISFDADADAAGNFSFDSIPCEMYILIVSSKRVKDAPMHLMENFIINRSEIATITGFKIGNSLDSLYTKGKYFDSVGREALAHYTDPSRALRIHQRCQDSLFQLALRFNRELPAEVFFKLGSSSFSKIDFDIVQVKQVGNKNKVIDFGITFI